jgi:hypothetical protein
MVVRFTTAYNQEHKVIGAVMIVWLLDLQQPIFQLYRGGKFYW